MPTMKTFLQLVAESLLNRFGNNLSHLTVVFPGKRASLFLDQALTEFSPTPVWAPTYKTISDLFQEASPYLLCDNVESVCRLYQAYAHHVENPQTLDQFYNWGEILLSDFDDVDKHLVDVQQLFTNIHDLRKLDDNSYITPEQEEALKSFFNNFSLEENSAIKERFLKLWEQMPAIYEELNANMRRDGLLYEGALQREVVESPIELSPDTTYIIVGFNVLNNVEQKLFDEMKHQQKALFYWDYDTYYVDTHGAGSRTQHEAGYFLSQNLDRYGNELSPDCFNNFRSPKQFTIISASSENVQARYLTQWLPEHRTEPDNETAVVLCNERLLLPVLHSIPDPKIPLNITMGFPFSDTPVYNFILTLVSLQTEGYNAQFRSFRHDALRTIQSHPYAHYIEESQLLRKVGGGKELLSYIQECLTTVARHLNDSDLVAQESIYLAYTRLNRIIDLMSGKEPLLNIGDATLLYILRSALCGETIPFHGEPAIGIQLMGVLETRALDFRNILMLSVGESYLPKKVSESSFIPYYLRDAFGLTTVKHKIAVYAYYFYRLIQRAENVTFVYNESNAGVQQNEISRFLRQLLAETDFQIQLHKLQADSAVTALQPIVRKKTPEMIRQLRNYYDNTGRQPRERHFLSPSAMNTYTTCSMRFFYRYVEEMRIDPDPQDGLDAMLFGDVFHRAAELLYRQLTSAGDVVRAEDIEPFLEMKGQRLEGFVRQAFKEKFFQDRPEDYRGILFIAHRVVTRYLTQLLRHDLRLTPFRIKGLEMSYTKTLHINGMEIDTGGIIDRLDIVTDPNVTDGAVIRVVDYKTGGKPDSVSDFERLFAQTDQKAHYYFQTILYASIVAEKENMPVTPCLFYVHKSGAEDYSPKLRLEGQVIHDVRESATKDENAGRLDHAFLEKLEQLIAEIFNPDVPFTQTEDIKACEYCDFRLLCGR